MVYVKFFRYKTLLKFYTDFINFAMLNVNCLKKI